MGDRLRARRGALERRAIARLTLANLAVFTFVIAVLSVVAFAGIAANERSIVEPALETPEGRAGLDAALRPALAAIVATDGALVIIVGLASYALSRVALEPLARAREREDRFASDVAHELRTPLAAIVAIAEAAQSGRSDDERDALRTIARRALELGTLVGDLLTLARASDTQSLDREFVDLAIVARGVIDDLSALPGDVAVDLRAESVVVDGDERRLRQLLFNLVANGRAFASSRVVVRVEQRERFAVLTVDDDGPGVDPAVIPRLFERFERGRGSTGSGLGLSICRWIVDAHEGTIVFAGGSRFVITLPVARIS